MPEYLTSTTRTTGLKTITSQFATILSATALLLASSAAYASKDHDHHDEDGHDDHHEEHTDNLDAHVHGIANLSIAIEDKEVEIVFTSPSEGIVGFEYAAKSHDEIHAVKDAKKHLLDGEELFEFDGADCELEHKEVNVSALLGKKEHHNDEEHHDEKHHSKKHHDDHDEGHHDKKHHGKKHHEEHTGGTHSEVSAEYHFFCDTTEKLEHIEVKLIEEFDRIQVINAQWVSEEHQGSAKIDKDHDHIEIR